MPQMLLRNGGNKCFKVDVTSDMVLLVQYEAPDLKMNDDGEDAADQRQRRTGSDGNEDSQGRYHTHYDKDGERFNRPIKVREFGIRRL